MTGAELEGEFSRGSFLTDDALRGLAKYGVDLEALVNRWGKGYDIPRQDMVGGKGAVTFLARDEKWEPVDIVAWFPALHKMSTLHDRAALLGAETVFDARMTEALPVFQSPLCWLKNACRGVVVVNRERAKPLLARAKPLDYRPAPVYNPLQSPKRGNVTIPSREASIIYAACLYGVGYLDDSVERFAHIDFTNPLLVRIASALISGIAPPQADVDMVAHSVPSPVPGFVKRMDIAAFTATVELQLREQARRRLRLA